MNTQPQANEENTINNLIDGAQFKKLIYSKLKAIFNSKEKLVKFTKKQRQNAESEFHFAVMKILETEESIPAYLALPETITVPKDALYEDLLKLYMSLTCGDNETLLTLTKQSFDISLMYMEALKDALTWEELELLANAKCYDFIAGKSRLIPANMDLIHSIGKDKILQYVEGKVEPDKPVNPTDPVEADQAVTKPEIVRPELDFDSLGWNSYKTNVEEGLVKIVNSGKIIEYLMIPGAENFPLYEKVLNYTIENLKMDEEFIRYELIWLRGDELEQYKQMEREANLFI